MGLPVNSISYVVQVTFGNGRLNTFEGTQPLGPSSSTPPTNAVITTAVAAMAADILTQMTVGTPLNPSLVAMDAIANTQD